MSARGRLLLFIVGLIPSVWLLRAVGSDAQSLWQVEYGRTPGVRKRIPYVEWPERGDDRLSQRRRYFYTRRLTHELTGLLPDREYHVRISARDPFGNVGTAIGTVRTLP